MAKAIQIVVYDMADNELPIYLTKKLENAVWRILQTADEKTVAHLVVKGEEDGE